MSITTAQTILVECLAFADALFWPQRDPYADHWPAVWVLRRGYRERGLPWRGGGFKELERAFGEAVRSGWLTRRRSGRKTVAAVLTRAGMAEAWRLTGESPYGDVIVLDSVLSAAPAGSWCPEIHWTPGHAGWGDHRTDLLAAVARTHQPALTSGLVDANCLPGGQVCYRATGAPRPEAPPGHAELPYPEADPDAAEVYRRAWKESEAWLAAQTNVLVGARGEIGELPLAPSQLIPYRDTPGSCLPPPALPRYNDGSVCRGWSLVDGRPVYDKAAAEADRRRYLEGIGTAPADGDGSR